MTCGCAIVASDTAPVREAIHNEDTGLLIDFFKPEELATKVIGLLENPVKRNKLGDRARAFAIANYDLKSVSLPRMLELIERVAANS